MAKPLVYRVEEIAEHISKEDLRQRFTPACQPRINVASLSRAADWNEQNRTLTATVLFAPDEILGKPQSLDPQLSIGSDFHGFTPLYTPDGAIEADIIALAGLTGHAYNSWAVSAEKMWLRDFLPHDLPKCRVLTYGYDICLEADGSCGILFDYSNNFITKLQDMRRQGRCLDRPVVFIGNGLGCLIIKEALIRFSSFSKSTVDQKMPSVVCLVFIGAPHRGLDVTSLQTLVEGRPSEDLVRELKRNSPTLTRLNSDFKNLYGDFNILTIYEMKDTPSIRLLEDGSWDKEGPLITMVEKDSAILYWEKEEIIGVTQNHRQMSKINRGQSGCYIQIRGFIQRSLEQRLRNEVPVTIQRGAIHSSTSPNDHTLIDDFFLAVRNSKSGGIQSMLDNGMQVNCHKGDRHTALHIAAEWASAEVVQLLLANGAEPNTYNRDGWTPFHFASRFNSATSLAVLLKAGADPSGLTERDKCNPLSIAARYNRSAKASKSLIDSGPRIETREINDWTPLHLAVRYGNRTEVITLLLQQGSAVNARNDEGHTALHLAAGHSTKEVLVLLLDAGAEIEARDGDCWTPLHWAVRFGREANIEELLKRGANCRAESSAGATPAQVGFVDTVPEPTMDLIMATLKTREDE